LTTPVSRKIVTHALWPLLFRLRQVPIGIRLRGAQRSTTAAGSRIWRTTRIDSPAASSRRSPAYLSSLPHPETSISATMPMTPRRTGGIVTGR
jgi:hypothetical protein